MKSMILLCVAALILGGCKGKSTSPETPAHVVFERWYSWASVTNPPNTISSGYVKNIGGTTGYDVRVASHQLYLGVYIPDTAITIPSAIAPGDLASFTTYGGNDTNHPPIDGIMWH